MKPKNRKWLLLSLAFGGVVAILSLAVYLIPPSEALSAVANEFTAYLCCGAIALAAFLLFSGIIASIWRFFDWAAVKTRCTLAANWLSAKVATKNANNISPCLQQFFYSILEQNRDSLHIPVGKNVSCLIPYGYAPAYRKGCVFYSFQLVVPEPPEMDPALLRLILQNCITSELMSHGIPYLPASFQSSAVGTLPSVFLDRVFYSTETHYLRFDLLFVGNEEAARYVGEAIRYEPAVAQPEIEVFDDQV